jgi:hypothetical protein
MLAHSVREAPSCLQAEREEPKQAIDHVSMSGNILFFLTLNDSMFIT